MYLEVQSYLWLLILVQLLAWCPDHHPDLSPTTTLTLIWPINPFMTLWFSLMLEWSGLWILFHPLSDVPELWPVCGLIPQAIEKGEVMSYSHSRSLPCCWWPGRRLWCLMGCVRKAQTWLWYSNRHWSLSSHRSLETKPKGILITVPISIFRNNNKKHRKTHWPWANNAT